MDFETLLRTMTSAAAEGQGEQAAACFTRDGVYHDVFYGAFQGRRNIADMIENYFHRDGENFRWDLFDPLRDGALGYARYVFSYDSKLPEAAGKRALFEGVCIVRLKHDLIADYREVANAAVGLSLMGFPPDRLAKFLAREAKSLAERPESAPHLRG